MEKMTRQERINRVLEYHKRVEEAWNQAKKEKVELPFIRKMVLKDIYFLLFYVLERKDLCYEEFVEGEVVEGIANGKGDVIVGKTEDGRNIWRWYRPFLFERCEEVQKNPDGYLDIWARDFYKDEWDGTPVYTLKGWKTQGTLEVGDYVLTPKGFSKVVAVRHFTDSHCMKVNFRGGVSVICGAGHLWKAYQWNSKRKGDKRVGWEENIVETSHLKKGCKHPYIACPKAYEGSDIPLPVDPYVLGAWLGDGDSSTGRMTNPDKEVWDNIEALGWILSHDHCHGTKTAQTRTIYHLSEELRHIGVLNNKHIPEIYLQAKYEDRLELLRGLMDTDGSMGKGRNDNSATFCNCNYDLVCDTMALASSLGFRCKVCHQTTNFNTDAYYMSFTVNPNDPSPFHIERKSNRINRELIPQKQSKNWYIQSIEEHPTVPTTCIQIEDPDGMYFTTEYCIPTHNSTIISYALSIQEILKNPEITICIYSYNVSRAQSLLVQVKNSLQGNQTLLACFPDVLFANTNVKTYKDKNGTTHKMEWGDDGFNVKRQGNPKEHTMEASGLVSGQKIGGHFNLLIYDDTVTPESVFTSSQIRKTTEAFKMSINTGSTANMRIRMIGTFYAMGDTYEQILKEGIVKLRKYTCWDENHEPQLYTKEALQRKLNKMSGYVQATQMECNPQAISLFQFQLDWIPPRIDKNSIQLDDYNWYIIVDPAIKVSEDADYTVMWAIGCAKDKTYLCADLIRDKLNLEGKQKALFKLVSKFTNSRKAPTVFYENLAMQSDVQHMEAKKAELKFYFELHSVSGKPKLTYGTTGGSNLKYKDLRIQALQPLLAQGKIRFVDSAIHDSWNGKVVDTLEEFFDEEYKNYPNTMHDDGLDALSRIADLETGIMMTFPLGREKIERKKDQYGADTIGDYIPY